MSVPLFWCWPLGSSWCAVLPAMACLPSLCSGLHPGVWTNRLLTKGTSRCLTYTIQPTYRCWTYLLHRYFTMLSESLSIIGQPYTTLNGYMLLRRIVCQQWIGVYKSCLLKTRHHKIWRITWTLKSAKGAHSFLEFFCEKKFRKIYNFRDK